MAIELRTIADSASWQALAAHATELEKLKLRDLIGDEARHNVLTTENSENGVPNGGFVPGLFSPKKRGQGQEKTKMKMKSPPFPLSSFLFSLLCANCGL